MKKNTDVSESYYSIFLAFEIDIDVLNDVGKEISEAREVLYRDLSKIIPVDEYDIFSSSLVSYQSEDNYNYLIVFSSFIKGSDKLPMNGYQQARGIKMKVKDEFVRFFTDMNIDYKLINTKLL